MDKERSEVEPSGSIPSFAACVERAVSLRRALHRAPELSWKEVRTAATIRRLLDQAGIPWRACAGTGTVARLASAAAGEHIAFRGDIDALPIAEQGEVAWRSEVPGCMHACGHDGHTATLMGLAWWLRLHERALPGPVSLVFQPAEEGGHGAERMIEEGALEGIDRIYGWHNWPAIPWGQAICPDGVVMAANGTFTIRVRGEGGHAATPEACRNPVPAAAAIALALQQVVAARSVPQQATVLSVTSIDAPSTGTIIPAEARIGGGIRCEGAHLRDRIYDAIEEIATRSAQAWGVEATLEREPRYDATRNHPLAASALRGALAAELGPAWRAEGVAVPIMASEDFSYYLQRIPGAFALIGADDGPAHAAPCHSPFYDFNDRLVAPVLRTFGRLAGLDAERIAEAAATR